MGRMVGARAYWAFAFRDCGELSFRTILGVDRVGVVLLCVTYMQIKILPPPPIQRVAPHEASCGEDGAATQQKMADGTSFC